MKRIATGLLLLSVLMPMEAVRACDFCLIHQGISPLETQNGAGLRVNQRYSLNDDVYEGDDHLPNPGTEEEFWTTDLSGFYSLIEDLLFNLNVPIRFTHVDGHMHVHGDGSVGVHDDVGGDEGLGDVSLLARYTPVRWHTLESTTLVAVTGGVKFATGSTTGRTDDGEFLDAHTQLGTGSTDWLLGLSFNHSLARLSFSGNVLLSLNGPGEAGDENHEYGNAANYDVTARYRVFPGTIGQSSNAMFISLGIVGEARGKEIEDGEKLVDSGGHTIYVAPGVQMNFGSHWIAEMSWHQAIYHDLNATQLGETFKVFGSLTYLF